MQPKRVRQEERVEVAPFQDFGQVSPVAQIAPFRCCAVGWVFPLSEREMADCEHVEAIQEDALLGGRFWCGWIWCLLYHFDALLN